MEIKIGDVVVVRQQFVRMVVERIDNDRAFRPIHCVWFVDGKVYRDSFVEESLEKTI